MSQLYCSPCDTNHALTQGQTERVVYAMSAALSIARTEDEQDRLFSGEDPFLRFPCLLEMLEMAASIEGYAEHVEATVEARRHVAKSARSALEAS